MRRALRIILWVLAGIFFILLVGIVFINTQSGKTFVKDRTVSFLRNKLKTEISIGSLDYDLPKMVVLENVLIRDRDRDTLLSARKMKVDIALLKLIGSNISIQEVYLDGVYSHIYRKQTDTVFNFDYIVKAFLTQGTDTVGKVEDTATRLQMNLDKLVLHDVRFRMDDWAGGSRVAFNVGDLNLTMKELDPERLMFRANRLYADKLQGIIIQDKSHLPEKKDTTPGPLLLQLGADEIDLNRSFYRQQDLVNKFFMDIDLGRLLAHPGLIDIPNQSIAIKDFTLDSSRVNVLMAARSAELAEQVADTMIETDPSPQAKWRVTANTLNLNQVAFVMNNESERPHPGLDYAHLNLQGLTLDAAEINYTTDTVAGVINQLALKEKSGLDIRELRTRFAYHPQGAYLRDLYLRTSRSVLQNYAEVSYPSQDLIAKHPELVQFDLNLERSTIGLRDVLLFAPQLAQEPFFRKHGAESLNLTAKAGGRLNAIRLKQLQLAGLRHTQLSASGIINGVPDVNRLSYDLNIQKLQSGRDDVEAFLPPAALKQLRLPDRFGAAGRISGTATSYNPNLLVLSTDGSARVRGNIAVSGKSGRYDLSLSTDGLNLGRILRQDTLLGIVTADLVVKGQGFDLNTMNAVAKGRIQAAGFKRYTYRNISFDGSIARKQAKVNLKAADPNAHFTLTGTADLREKYPAFVADATIDSIDLQALHFYASELKVRGKLHASVQDLNPDYPRGTVVLDDPTIAVNGSNYFLDSLYLVSSPTAEGGNDIIIESRAIHAHIWGHTPLTKIPDIVQYHIDRHYAFNDSTLNKRAKAPKKYAVPASYDLHLLAKVENDPVVQGFVPELKSFDTVRIEGGLSPQRIYLNADAPQISYAGYNITQGKIRINGDDSALTYLASVDHFQQKQMDIWYAKASGQLHMNLITSDVSIGDPENKQKFALSATLQRSGKEQILQLHRGLMLNYKEWTVNEPNRIVFASEGFYVENFGISNGAERIMVNSSNPSFNAPLHADISNFLLSNITSIVSKDTLLANGVLSGNVEMQDIRSEPRATGTLTVNGLSVMGDTVGNVAVNLKSATANAIDAQVNITGQGNNIILEGLYYPKPVDGNNLNMTLKLDPLNVASIEGLAMHQIRNTSGYLRGDLAVKGTLTNPSLRGELTTDKLSTNVAMLNSQFTMPHETISFGGRTIILDNFDIQDNTGNKATIDGSINTRGFSKDMLLALSIRANNWQAMNSTVKENKDFYGKLLLTTNMTIFGPVAAPSIDGSLNILKGTSVTVTIPDRQANIQERDGIVEFVNMSDTNRYLALATDEPDTLEKLGQLPPGSELNLNISTHEEAEFSVIIDEGAGDFVKVRGKSDLNATVAPDGTLGLVGTYEITDGSYHLNYNFIQRNFNIQQGSTIVFSGAPEEAELNVTAIYEANVPPYDLVEKQVSDPAQLIYFKQRLPFEVQMKLTGPLMQPALAFDVVLPEEKNYRVASDVTDVVQARLGELRSNPSELNKQVFALIILNRFVGDNPFENGAGGRDAEAIARQSASRFISEQLNKFAGGLVEGLDLTLDVNSSEDFTTGERRNRTDLSLGASKRLLNDRLTINVGNNFQLEGPRTNSSQGTSLIPGNIAVDYDLTADKRYRVRFYRRNEDLGAFEGFVVSTGASFILQVDYNRFRQVFMNRRKMMRQREERRKQREASTKNENNKEQLPAIQPGAAVVIGKNEDTDKE